MFRIFIYCTVFISTINFCKAEKEFTAEYALMGSKFIFTVICSNEKQAQEAFAVAKNEVSRIEKLISSWIETLVHKKYNLKLKL